MNYGRLCFFGLGIFVGAGAVIAVQSGLGKKACVGLLSKGLELKETTEIIMERAKEGLEDVLAESRYINEQKQNGVTA